LVILFDEGETGKKAAVDIKELVVPEQ
jgi:hypothetical protein